MKELLLKHKQLILYVFFGGLTTGVNAAVYFFVSWGFDASAWLSSVISWLFAVCFAFVVNKLFVFESKSKSGVGKEIVLFFTARIVSLLLNVGIMWVFVDILEMNEILFFVIGQAVVLVFNYIASKFVIFRKRGDKQE